MKKSNLFTVGIVVIAALFCVTCEDNSGRSPGEDEDAASFANKFRGGEPTNPNTPNDPCVTNPTPNCANYCQVYPTAAQCQNDPCATNNPTPNCANYCQVYPNAAQCQNDPCATNNPTPNCDNYCQVYPNAAQCQNDPCAGGVSAACCNAQPNYQGCSPPPTTYTLRITSDPFYGGTTTPASPKENITSGTPVSISATPASGYIFDNWTVTSGSATISNANSATTTVTSTSNATIKANFTQQSTQSACAVNFQSKKIGTQTWMTENLNCETAGGVCYDNNPANCTKYGRLYSLVEAMGACPAGWKLPTDDDWTKLVEHAGGEATAGKKLKATSGWNNNGNGTDDYGFAALPGGNGYPDGDFYVAGNCGYWWRAAERGDNIAYGRFMGDDGEYVGRFGSDGPYLYSVRCVAD